MEIIVECYSGWRGEETPRRIRMGEREIAVEGILDRWLSPDHRYFKFIGDDGGLYIIRHDCREWRWELTLYRREDPPPPANAPTGST